MHNQTIGEWIGVANTVEDIRNIPIECIREQCSTDLGEE